MSFETVTEVVHALHAKGVAIAINPSKKLIERKITGLNDILSKANVVILNHEEGAYLAGVGYDDEEKIFSVLDAAVPGILALTDGDKGIMISDGERIYKAGIFEAPVVDRLGAGDAFGSGFVAGLMAQEEKCKKGTCAPDKIEYAIRLGSANATSVIGAIGAKAGILTKEDFSDPRWRNFKIHILG